MKLHDRSWFTLIVFFLVTTLALSLVFAAVFAGVTAAIGDSAQTEERPGLEVCGEAANGNDAVTQTEQLAPDLPIIDLAMPDKNGIQAARKSLQSPP
jgi:DNA-binding NarL/FixJ family response regulator